MTIYGQVQRIGQVPNIRDVQNNSFTYAAAGGTANALTISLSPAPSGYFAGMIVRFMAASNNTAATTINVSSLGPKNLYKFSSGVLGNIAADDLISGGMYEAIYDGTQFQLLGVTPPQASSAGWDLIAIGTASSSSSLDFTSGISSDYDSYVLDLIGIRPASNADLLIRFSDTDTASFYAGASDYGHARTQVDNSTTTDSYSAGATSILVLSQATASAANGIHGQIRFSQKASRRISANWSVGSSTESAVSIKRSVGHGMCRATTTQVDGLRLLFSTGNISEGTAKLYGLRSSL